MLQISDVFAGIRMHLTLCIAQITDLRAGLRMACQFVTPATEDRPRILRHLLQLSVADRALRFGTAAQDDAIIDYCGRWNFARDIVEGARQDESGHWRVVVSV
jgi:hypothetical protein